MTSASTVTKSLTVYYCYCWELTQKKKKTHWHRQLIKLSLALPKKRYPHDHLQRSHLLPGCWTPGSVWACDPHGSILSVSLASSQTSCLTCASHPWSCSSMGRCLVSECDIKQKMKESGKLAYVSKGCFWARINLCYKSYHVEPKETVTQKHLDLLVVCREIAMRVASCILVHSSPFITRRSELICSERAGTRSEAACQYNALLPIPLLVVLKDPCMAGQILQRNQTFQWTIKSWTSSQLYRTK